MSTEKKLINMVVHNKVMTPSGVEVLVDEEVEGALSFELPESGYGPAKLQLTDEGAKHLRFSDILTKKRDGWHAGSDYKWRATAHYADDDGVANETVVDVESEHGDSGRRQVGEELALGEGDSEDDYS